MIGCRRTVIERVPIAALPATDATDSPNPSPGSGAANVTGGVNVRGTNAGGTSLTVIAAIAELIPPKPSLTVSMTLNVPTDR